MQTNLSFEILNLVHLFSEARYCHTSKQAPVL